MVVSQLIQREVGTKGSSIARRDAQEILDALQPRRGPERMPGAERIRILVVIMCEEKCVSFWVRIANYVCRNRV